MPPPEGRGWARSGESNIIDNYLVSRQISNVG